MANKKVNKESSKKDEYVEFLEDTLGEMSLALIIDMERHGIFTEKGDEFVVTDKFMNKLYEESSKLLSEETDEDEIIGEAVYNAIKSFYPEDTLEEEIYPRADIVVGFVLEDLEDYLSQNKEK